jgi:NAD(P)H dehydrogenase (quinone)
MPIVSVIYFSGTGHTTKLAEAVQKEAAAVAGVKTNLIAINGDDIVKGRYQNDTVSSEPNGDKFSVLQYFHTLAMQHGMIWVGPGEMPMQPNGVNRLGSFGGAMAQAMQEAPEVAPNEADKLTGEILGKRVAQFALKLKK